MFKLPWHLSANLSHTPTNGQFETSWIKGVKTIARESVCSDTLQVYRLTTGSCNIRLLDILWPNASDKKIRFFASVMVFQYKVPLPSHKRSIETGQGDCSNRRKPMRKLVWLIWVCHEKGQKAWVNIWVDRTAKKAKVGKMKAAWRKCRCR